MTVGSYEEAVHAVNKKLKKLGSGAHRHAYINDSRTVVYKIHRYSGDDGNQREYENYLRLSVRDDIPEGLVIPEVTLYQVMGQPVNAMPFVDGKAPYVLRDRNYILGNQISDWLRQRKIYDSGHDNMLIDSAGIVHLVDIEA